MLPFVNDNPINAFHAASTGIPLALRTGDDALMRACARPGLLQEAFASKDPVVYGPIASAVAQQLFAQSRFDEARALVDRAVNDLEDAGNNFELLMTAARIGCTHSVERALQLLEPWSARSRSAKSAIAYIAAHKGKGRERAAAALACAQGFASLPWPLHEAQALELAGDLDAACAIYRKCGAWADAARLERQLSPSVGGGALSKREIEVAKLVADGLSNRAIADRLVLSERTVENHVAAIFTKLNMRSRAEIAAHVAREHKATV
jgi:DNA-binding CsgD family transcriptional regulator